MSRYMTEALKPALVPFVNRHNRQMTFMHDNAPEHRAHATRGWLAHNIPIFGPWPSKSPDMNPIKNLWAQLQIAIDNRPNRPQNKAQLWRAVQEEWRNVNMWDVRRLIFSMRRRCTALAQAAGGHTKYWKYLIIYFNDLMKTYYAYYVSFCINMWCLSTTANFLFCYVPFCDFDFATYVFVSNILLRVFIAYARFLCQCIRIWIRFSLVYGINMFKFYQAQKQVKSQWGVISVWHGTYKNIRLYVLYESMR